MTNIKYKALWKLFVGKYKIIFYPRILGGKQARKSFSNSSLSNLPPPTVLPPQSHTQIILWSHCRIDFLRCDLLSVGIQIRYKYSAAVGNIYFSSTVGGKILSVDIFPDGLLSVNTLHLWSPSTRWRATSPLLQPRETDCQLNCLKQRTIYTHLEAGMLDDVRQSSPWPLWCICLMNCQLHRTISVCSEKLLGTVWSNDQAAQSQNLWSVIIPHHLLR